MLTSAISRLTRSIRTPRATTALLTEGTNGKHPKGCPKATPLPKTRSRTLAALGICGAVILLLCSTAKAYSQSEGGSVYGVVADPTGAVVSHADVILTNRDHNGFRRSISNAKGFYEFANVAPGAYQLQVISKGFRVTLIKDVIVETRESREQNVHLTLGSASEFITVEANGVSVNTSDASIGTVVDQEFVKNIPLNGRTFQSLLLLTPGIVFTPGEQGQLSVNGGRTDSNYFTVDGVSGNIGVGVQSLYDQSASGSVPGFNSFGGTQSLLSVDAMEEVKISTSTYSAEFGRQPGAQVSLVTKGGTNRFHGTVFDYLRNSATDANDWFSDNLSTPKIASRQNDFGGTFGGPLTIPRLYSGASRKTFFFFNYEGLRLALPQPTRAFNVPAACLHGNASLNVELQELVNAFPVPNTLPGSCAAGGTGVGTFTTGYDNYTNMNNEALRLDQAFGNKWVVFVRSNHAKSEGDIYTLGGLTHYPSETDTETLGITTQITTRLSNSLRLNFSKDVAQANYEWTTRFGGTPIPDIGNFLPSGAPNYAVPQFLIGGESYTTGPYTYHRSADWNVVENLQWQRGKHSVVFGTDIRWVKPRYIDNGYVFQISFSNLTNILANQGAGTLYTTLPLEAHVHNYSFYGNDVWRPTQRLTVNYGLRWDINPAPTFGQYNLPAYTGFPDVTAINVAPSGTPYYPTFLGEFAPRLGVTYLLRSGADHDTVLRGGWGVYYDLGTGTALSTSHSFPFATTQSIALQPFPFAPGTVTNPSLPLPITSPLSNSGFKGLQNLDGLPRTQQYSFGIEQQLGKNQLIGINYVGNHGQKQLERYSFNYLDGTTDPNIQAGNSFVITRNDGQAGGFSWYNGLQVNYQRSMASGLQLLANYSYSHALDANSNDSQFLTSRIPNTVSTEDASAYYGTSDYDRRHIINLALVYNLPRFHSQASAFHVAEQIFTDGWILSPNLKYQSGSPFTMRFTYFDLRNHTGITSLFLDKVPGQPLYSLDPINPGGQSFNPAAFTIPAADLQPNQALLVNGDAGRNTFTGPSLTQLDFALRRNFALTEKVTFQFSAEFFNLFNHPNFASPDGNYGYVFNRSPFGPSPCPGNPSGVSCDFNFPNPRNGKHTPFFTAGTFGELNTLANGVQAGAGAGSSFDVSLNPRYALGGPRSAQFSARISF